jgi:hypothetical protein
MDGLDEDLWDEWDFWEQAGLTCCGYGSDSDKHLIDVFIETSKEDHWYESIAHRLGLDKFYVQLLIEILCSADFCEYGTSPRGAWAIRDKYEENLGKLQEWYSKKWERASVRATMFPPAA